jgi:8-oxo-dGTP diphosphatase
MIDKNPDLEGPMPRTSQMRPDLRLAADIVIMTLREGRPHVLLVERLNDPFRGQWALPGGFVEAGESADDAALRELQEETSIDGRHLHLEQVHTYSAPDRDPRGRVVTVAYLAIAPNLPEPVGGADARRADWMPVDGLLNRSVPLAFDHIEIVSDAVERARAKLENTSLATAFCEEPFTIADLRRVYEAVWGATLDPGNFSRKVTNTEGFVVPTGAVRPGERGRPPALYRRGGAVTLYPPILRSSV